MLIINYCYLFPLMSPSEKNSEEDISKAIIPVNVVGKPFTHAQYIPLQYKPFLFSNSLPGLKCYRSEGIWKRLRYIPFSLNPDDDEEDSHSSIFDEEIEATYLDCDYDNHDNINKLNNGETIIINICDTTQLCPRRYNIEEVD